MSLLVLRSFALDPLEQENKMGPKSMFVFSFNSFDFMHFLLQHETENVHACSECNESRIDQVQSRNLLGFQA